MKGKTCTFRVSPEIDKFFTKQILSQPSTPVRLAPTMGKRLFHRLLITSVSLIALILPLAAAGQVAGQVKDRPDSLGTISAQRISCPNSGLVGTDCYALQVSCPEIQDYTVYLKTFAPSGNPVGTVTLTQGGTSIALYEDYDFGTVTLDNLRSAGFLSVEITFGKPFNNFEQGWQTNTRGTGVRTASCRYATVTAWIKRNLAPAIPLCAAGVSAGSQQIAEGLSHYGLGEYLTFAELASGPPFNRTDEACINGGQHEVEYCSGSFIGMQVTLNDARQYIDPAYPGSWCSTDLRSNRNDHEAQFFADSVTSQDAELNYPSTNVWFMYGGLDTSAAINQGENYRSQIRSTNRVGCVQDAPHLIPDSISGAQQIASDMIAQCR